MERRGNSYVYIAILAVSLFMVLWSLFMIPYFQSKLLPMIVGSIVLLLAAIGLWGEILTEREQNSPAGGEESQGLMTEETLGGYLANLSWLVGFLVGIYLVGYLLTIPIFVLSYMKRLGTGLMVATISSLITTAFIYGVFEMALELRLHRGLLFTWLGY